MSTRNERQRIIVEKVGGTSMSRFEVVLENVIKRNPHPGAGRIIVVSAYGGITNLLLNHKKNNTPGIYGRFARGEDVEAEFERLKSTLLKINQNLEALGLKKEIALDFVEDRLAGARRFLDKVSQVVAFGYVDRNALMLAARELVASIGESHSAFNTVAILKAQGIDCELVDLSGWHDTAELSIDERIQRSLEKVNLREKMAIVTGYCKGTEGIMRVFDRGYSEITFSRVATLMQACEAIIHKEYHLSSGDPAIIGEDKVVPIGDTNFDVADQLADIEMEAIHPKASKPLERLSIPIRVRNVFDPEHQGTLISTTYCSDHPRVEIISGCDRVVVVQIHDTAMVGEVGFDYRIMQSLAELGISYTFKSTDANTIAIGLLERDWNSEIEEYLRDQFVDVVTKRVAVVCAIGSNMGAPGFLGLAAQALAEAKVNILAITQSTRQTNMQFLIERNDFVEAQRALHRTLCEEQDK